LLPGKAAAASVLNVPIQQHPSATPTPACIAEVLALKDDIAKLRSENTRLKKIKPSRAKEALPLACPSMTPIFAPSRLSTNDCDALTNAQQLADTAAQSRLEAVNAGLSLSAEIQNGQYKASEVNGVEAVIAAQLRVRNAAIAEQQAESSLADLRTRLCANPRIQDFLICDLRFLFGFAGFTGGVVSIRLSASSKVMDGGYGLDVYASADLPRWMGGWAALKGGKARAFKLSKEKLSEIGRKAVQTRWAKHKERDNDHACSVKQNATSA
jgi:hypothetical protein